MVLSCWGIEMVKTENRKPWGGGRRGVRGVEAGGSVVLVIVLVVGPGVLCFVCNMQYLISLSLSGRGVRDGA